MQSSILRQSLRRPNLQHPKLQDIPILSGYALGRNQVSMTLGATTNSYVISSHLPGYLIYSNIQCTQHSKRGVNIDGKLCNKVDFVTPALGKDELVELRGLWIRYDRLGTRYSKCGPAPDFLSTEAVTSDDSSSSSPAATPYPSSSLSIPFSSSPVTPITVNRKRKRDTPELSFSPVSKRTKYFDLTRPRAQRITASGSNHTLLPSGKTIIDLTVLDGESDNTPPPPSFAGPGSATIIDLTVADTEVDLHGTRASRRAEAQKRLASMTYLGSVEIDD